MLVLLMLSSLMACTKKGSLTLDRTELTLENQAVQLVATVTPEQDLLWTSSNENIARVYAGWVVPVRNGVATVTVSTRDGQLSAQCTVTVSGFVKNLSEEGTANCYIIPEGGRYKFLCVRGHQKDTPISGVRNIRVLWESTFNNRGVEKKDLVADVTYEDGWVYFQTGKETRGNAVIAVSDELGNVLWSWHLWFSRGFVPDKFQQTYKDGSIWMDRNLGASTDAIAANFGLMYQWGRKDPFPGPFSNSGTKSPVTPAFPDPSPASNHQSAAGGVVGFARANPMVFLTCSTSENWCLNTALLELWNSSKSIHDPCPLGWRVPAYNWEVAAEKASSEYGKVRNYNVGTLGYVSDLGRDLAGMQDRMLTYPAAGYYDNDGNLVNVTKEVKVWATTLYESSYVRVLKADGTQAYFSDKLSKANGAASIRCVKQR